MDESAAQPTARLADQLAEQSDGRSATVVVTQGGDTTLELALGEANRADHIPNTLDTRFGVASVTKGFTALTVMSLVDEGRLQLDTNVHELLGDILPLIDQRVTVEHLLTHRSGVGDHLDEEQLGDIDDHVLGGRSAHTFATNTDYVGLLADVPHAFAPGERFAYNNGAFVMLGMIVERLVGSFHDAVAERVLRPAGMADSGFFRSDDLPAPTALGYLRNGRTNVFHLPVIGAGDGGVHLTAPDCIRFWAALRSGQIVSPDTVAAMTEVVTPDAGTDTAYGRGFWLSPDADHVWLEGMDAGVSAQTGWFPSADLTYAVLSNNSSDAWPLVEAIVEHAGAEAPG